MSKFRYLHMVIKDDTNAMVEEYTEEGYFRWEGEIVKLMYKLGDEGWELVAVLTEPLVIYIFKKQIFDG